MCALLIGHHTWAAPNFACTLSESGALSRAVHVRAVAASSAALTPARHRCKEPRVRFQPRKRQRAVSAELPLLRTEVFRPQCSIRELPRLDVAAELPARAYHQRVRAPTRISPRITARGSPRHASAVSATWPTTILSTRPPPAASTYPPHAQHPFALPPPLPSECPVHDSPAARYLAA